MEALSGISAFWIAAGAIAAALPIAAHLLARRRPPTVEFPAARLVREAIAPHARRRRLRDIVLLTLRVAAVALLALAFDRPAALLAAEDPAAEDGRDVVIVLDASASMSRTASGRTLFDRARERAMAIVRSVDPARDRVAVIIAGRTPRPLLPALSRNLGALAEELASAEPTLERCDLAAALELAGSLQGAPGDSTDGAPRPRAIVVVSDLQRATWESASTVPAGAAAIVEDVGADAPARNVAVESLTLASHGAQVRLRNYGDSEEQVSLQIGAGPIGREPEVLGGAAVQLAPGEERTILVELGAAPEAHAAVRAWIEDGEFAPDDEAWRLGDSARAVAVLASDVAAERSGARFVAAAVEAATGRPAGPLTPDASAIVVAGEVPAASLQAIVNAARRGAGVVWFVDSEASLEALRRFASDAGAAGLADWLAAARFERGASRGMAPPAPGGPLLGGLGASPAIFDEVRFTARLVGATPPSSASALTFDDGAPLAMVDRAASGGALVVIGADVGIDASTIARSPLLPALVLDSIVVAAASGGAAFEVGEPILLRAAGGVDESTLVRDADGRLAAVVQTDGGTSIALRPRTSPGIAAAFDESGAVVAAGVVALAREERSFERITLEEAHAAIAPPGMDSAEVRSNAATIARPAPIELWPAIAAGAALMLCVESLVASWRGPARTNRREVAP